MVDTEFARLSDQLMLGAVLLYVCAMVGYAADLAFSRRRVDADRTAAAKAQEAGHEPSQEKVLVGVAAAESAGSSGAAASAGSAGMTAGADRDPAGGSAAAPVRRELDWGRFAVLTSVLGWGLHLGMLATRGLAVQRWPWGNMYEFLSAIAFAAVTAYLVLLARQRVRYLGVFVMLAVVVALGVASIWLYTDAGPVVPALNSYWIAIHVTAAIAATGAFTVGGVATALYLVALRRADRRGRSDRMDRPSRLPAAQALDRIGHRTVMFAFPIWTFAIIAGAIWADQAWGRYWGWDPKEVWSFVTWVVYAGYLHARATAGWKGRRAAVISLVAYCCLLFNFFGVNYIFSGLHSYA